MYDTIDAYDITLCLADGAVHIDIDTVGPVGDVVDRQFLVIETGHDELGLVLCGEFGSGVRFCLQSSVNDGVEDYHLADGVQLSAVGKGIPGWIGQYGGVFLA